MTHYLLAGLLLISTVTNAQTKPKPSNALDEKNGFRTYHFGDDISKYPFLVKKEDGGSTKFYGNPRDNMHVGDADLKELTYAFYKGKLAMILIETSGSLNSHKLLAALVAQYGKGSQNNEYIEDYWWHGKKVSMNYEEKSITHNASVTITTEAVVDQMQADDKRAAKKASSDL